MHHVDYICYLGTILFDIRVWTSQLDLSFSWVNCNCNCNFVAQIVAKTSFDSRNTIFWDVFFLAQITSIVRS